MAGTDGSNRTRGVTITCVLLLVILVTIILLCENGKLGFQGGGCPDVSTAEFEQLIRDKEIVMAIGYAPWCGFCKKIMNTLDDLANKYSKDGSVGVCKVDATTNKDFAEKYGIRGFPTILLFKNGKNAGTYQGERDTKSLSSFIEKHK